MTISLPITNYTTGVRMWHRSRAYSLGHEPVPTLDARSDQCILTTA